MDERPRKRPQPQGRRRSQRKRHIAHPVIENEERQESFSEETQIRPQRSNRHSGTKRLRNGSPKLPAQPRKNAPRATEAERELPIRRAESWIAGSEQLSQRPHQVVSLGPPGALPACHPLVEQMEELKCARIKRTRYWLRVARRLGDAWDLPDAPDRLKFEQEEVLADQASQDIAVAIAFAQRGILLNAVPFLRHTLEEEELEKDSTRLGIEMESGAAGFGIGGDPDEESRRLEIRTRYADGQSPEEAAKNSVHAWLGDQQRLWLEQQAAEPPSVNEESGHSSNHEPQGDGGWQQAGDEQAPKLHLYNTRGTIEDQAAVNLDEVLDILFKAAGPDSAEAPGDGLGAQWITSW